MAEQRDIDRKAAAREAAARDGSQEKALAARDAAMASVSESTTDEEILVLARGLTEQHGFNTSHAVFYLRQRREQLAHG